MVITIKIGVFCPTLNVYGGGEFVAVALANTLAQNGHKVIFFTSHQINTPDIKTYFGETLNPTIQNIVQPTHFNPRELADFYQTIIHSYIAKSKCATFIDAFSNCVFPWTDITYIHFPYLNQYAFTKKFPYLTNPHIMQAATIPHVLLEKTLIDYDHRLVVANSCYTAGEIKQYSGKTVEVLYPPFSSCISAIGKNTPKDSEQNLVVTTSRLDFNKLLERIPYIAALTNPKIHFAIIGRLYNPAPLANLQRLTKKMGLSNRISFYPNLPTPQKIELLKKAKLYLHTMIGEHFGISIVEAMALGCIPIVHDSGGMREFVAPKYRYRTIEEAAAKIETEITSWSPLNAENAKTVAQKFSIQNFSLKFMQLFEKHYN